MPKQALKKLQEELILADKNYDLIDECLETLGKLVDLSTPKYPIVKVDKNNITTFKCPTCGIALIGTCTECYRKIKYCSECGQKFDTEWEAEDE